MLLAHLIQAGYYGHPSGFFYGMSAGTMGSWILIIVIGIVGWIVQARLQSVFAKYARVPFPGGLTGAEVAEKMLRDNGIRNVKVTHVAGHLTDHFNPQTICGIPLRRANILSDVLRFDDKEAADETLPELDDEFSGDFHRFAGQLDAGEAPLPADSIAAEPPAADTLSAAPQLAFEWTPADSEPPTEPPTGDTARLLTTLTPIEDFDTLADGPL